MVDVADSKSADGDIVWVRVPPPAPPRRSKLYIACSDFLCLWQKSQSALMPLLLLSKSKPLRWASIWIHLTETADSVSPLAPRRSKLYIACSDFLCLWQKSQSALMPLLLLSKPKPPDGLRFGFGCKPGSCWNPYCCDAPKIGKRRQWIADFYLFTHIFHYIRWTNF